MIGEVRTSNLRDLAKANTFVYKLLQYFMIYKMKYSQLSVSRTTDKLDFSKSRTHLVGLVEFVSSSMLN